MNPFTAKIRFDKSGYYFIGLLILAVLGFWKTYFFKILSGKNDFSFYFHFHATMMVIWVLLLIVQPILIRQKKLQLHKQLGKVTYVIMPLLLISVLLVLNSGLKKTPINEVSFAAILFPVRDFFLLLVAFAIGVYYRKNIQVHARAMVITGIVFIEPALFRFLNHIVFQNSGLLAGLVGVGLMIATIVTMIVIERKQKSARWLFPSLLVIYLIAYSIVIFEIPTGFLDPLARWLAKLPLT